MSNSEEQKILNVNTKGNIGASSLHVSDSDSNSINIKLKLGEQKFIDHAIKRIDLIKIDIEGHEAEAILGMQESIKKYRPVVVLEWNCDRTREKFSRNEIFQKVFNGFVTVVLSDNHSNFCQSVRKAPFIKIFRKCLNPLHKTFMRRKLILNAFNYSENYGHLLIIPNEKIQ